jgi:hypothetical protein
MEFPELGGKVGRNFPNPVSKITFSGVSNWPWLKALKKSERN